MSDNYEIKALNHCHEALWLKASKILSYTTLQEEIFETIKWAPPLTRGDIVYEISRTQLPHSAWSSIQEITTWGMADKTQSNPEVIYVDASILDLVMEAIRRLLSTIMNDSSGDLVSPTLESRQIAPVAGGRKKLISSANSIEYGK